MSERKISMQKQRRFSSHSSTATCSDSKASRRDCAAQHGFLELIPAFIHILIIFYMYRMSKKQTDVNARCLIEVSQTAALKDEIHHDSLYANSWLGLSVSWESAMAANGWYCMHTASFTGFPNTSCWLVCYRHKSEAFYWPDTHTKKKPI